MPIRIRVYPQAGSIGARRNRAAKAQRLAAHRAQVAFARQQLALDRQRAMLQQQALSMNAGFGGAWGGSSMLGGYGSRVGFGGFGGYSPQAIACPPSPSSLLGGYGGAGFLAPGILGQHSYGYGQSAAISPWGVSQYNGVSQYGAQQYGAYGC